MLFETIPLNFFVFCGFLWIASDLAVRNEGLHLNAGACHTLTPAHNGEQTLHVFYAGDAREMDGIKASIASVITSASAPRDVKIHILTESRHVNEFKGNFGIQAGCEAGPLSEAFIHVHGINREDIEPFRAVMSDDLKKERGPLDVSEEPARLFIDRFVGSGIAVYLDADIIVQSDLKPLREVLMVSNKTIGFVKRATPKTFKYLQRHLEDCEVSLGDVTDMANTDVYNTGVLVFNVQRWKHAGYLQQIKDLAAKQRHCGGALWKDASQTPLNLAFRLAPDGSTQSLPDYVLFDATWNYDGLGWNHDFLVEELRRKNVLHWSGAKKPWKDNGLYTELWLPHRQEFERLIR